MDYRCCYSTFNRYGVNQLLINSDSTEALMTRGILQGMHQQMRALNDIYPATWTRNCVNKDGKCSPKLNVKLVI